MRSFGRAVFVVLSLAAALPAGSAAQGLRISAGAGMYAPVRDLGEIRGPAGLVEFGKRESTLAYALAFEVGRADRSVGFRLGAMYAGRSDVPIDGVGCAACTLRSTLLAASAGVIIRPLPDMPVLRPWLLLGAGAKLYDFDADTFTASLVEDQALFLGHVGVGFTLFPDAGFGLFAELSDYINGFEFADGSGDLQHDLVFLGGVTVGG